MCMLIYVQVPRDINHKPCASSCLQRDRFVPLSHHDMLHMNAHSFVCVYVCVFISGIQLFQTIDVGVASSQSS